MTPSFTRRRPEGDTHERAVCDHCDFVAYDNPKIVVGAVVEHGNEILLCRRAINPSRGLWTLPAGYLEHGETPEEGARREAWEEAEAEIDIVGLLAVYTIRRLGQVQLIYRARLGERRFAAGRESLAVGLFTADAIPWDKLAFPSVRWALSHAKHKGGPFANPPDAEDATPEEHAAVTRW